jgi:hypothetical protein
MSPEDVGGIQGGLLRHAEEAHVGFLRIATTLAVIAGGAGGHDIVPDVRTPLKSGDHVVHGEPYFTTTTVLARIIVATKDFAASELYVRSRPAHLEFKANDGGAGHLKRYSSHVSTAVGHHGGFAAKDKHHRPPRRANVDRFEVGVEYEDGFVHLKPNILPIIA